MTGLQLRSRIAAGATVRLTARYGFLGVRNERYPCEPADAGSTCWLLPHHIVRYGRAPYRPRSAAIGANKLVQKTKHTRDD
jgi:hypothetical protein